MGGARRIIAHVNCRCLSPPSQVAVVLLLGFLVILYARDLLVLDLVYKDSSLTHDRSEDKRIDMCRSSTMHPKIMKNIFSNSRDLSSILEGPGLDNVLQNNYTACKFQFNDHSSHFTHAMQQLFRCTSYWMTFPDKERWLVMQKPIAQMFIVGYIDAIRELLDVKVVRFRHTLQVARPVVDYGFDREQDHLGFALHKPTDLDYLRDELYFRNNKSSTQISRCKQNAGMIRDEGSKTHKEVQLPTVTIINRKFDDGRKLLNAKKIKFAMEEELQIQVNIVDFDSSSFLDQVDIMGQTDILLSPHGAQLTSIPFLPDCGRVTEVFSLGYYVPEFFGTLADASGKSYSSVYAGGNDMESEVRTWMKSSETRDIARHIPVCPNVETVLAHMKSEITAWRACCS